MDVTLRKARETDRPFLLELRKSTMAGHLEAAGIFPSNDDHAIRVGENFDCAHVIECSGLPIGLAKYRESADAVEILQFQVLPEYQGKGIGRRVAGSIIERARLRGKRVTLTVLKANPAKRLYESLGFCVVGEDEYEFHMQLFG